MRSYSSIPLLYADGELCHKFPDPEKMKSLPADKPIAAGGDLRPQTLLQAYCHGVFPWFDHDQHILWWSPDPRCVLWPEDYHLPGRLKRNLKKFEIVTAADFATVIRACAEPRKHSEHTWITPGMIQAYTILHQLGYAEAIAVYIAGELAGGIYGVRLGRMFFAESMFSYYSGASRVALACLAGTIDSPLPRCKLIDCQEQSPHLATMGAINMNRAKFLRHLELFISPGT